MADEEAVPEKHKHLREKLIKALRATGHVAEAGLEPIAALVIELTTGLGEG